MKLVTLAEPMRGVGDRPLLPDAVADRMVADGTATAAEPWPAKAPAAPTAQKPKRPVVKSARPAGLFDDRLAR
jgi:hypothetical protein